MPKLIRKLLALTAITLSLICAAAAFFGIDALTLAYRIIFPLLSPTGSFCALVVLLLAVVAAYSQFKPKLSLEPQVPLKSDSVLDTPFRVTNESFLPIHNLKQEWLIERSRTFLPQGYYNEVEELDTQADDSYPR